MGTLLIDNMGEIDKVKITFGFHAITEDFSEEPKPIEVAYTLTFYGKIVPSFPINYENDYRIDVRRDEVIIDDEAYDWNISYAGYGKGKNFAENHSGDFSVGEQFIYLKTIERPEYIEP